MKTLITICARGGSKGIPGKNIKKLNGKPLIYYSIQVAKQFQNKFKDVDIIISSDFDEIIKVAENFGIKSNYKRPLDLGGDAVGKIEAIADVLHWQEETKSCTYDYILDLDVTSPLRNLHDLVTAFKLIQEDNIAVNLFSVSPANRNPYFNMVEQKENGFYAQVKQPIGMVLTRQSSPKVYDMNASFYFYKRQFFMEEYKSSITDKSLIYIVPHICFDLDHIIDFEFITFLMENNKLGFEL